MALRIAIILVKPLQHAKNTGDADARALTHITHENTRSGKRLLRISTVRTVAPRRRLVRNYKSMRVC